MECRKSVRNLSAAEKTAYVNAVLALKTAPSKIPAAATAVTGGGGTPNRYDDYVWVHNVIGGGAHRGPAFAPWHREFLKQFELDLRIVSGNPDITIPYWDWTVDNDPGDPGWPFTNDFLGSFGDPTTGLVTTGPFSNPATWRINIRRAADAVTQLKRNRGVPDGSFLPIRSAVLPSLTIGDFDVSPYHSDPNTLTVAQRTAQANASFRKFLEWLLHDGIHVWIGGRWAGGTDGGHMTFPSVAVNDPVFFLHHSNVDRLWTIWQQKNPTLDYQPAAGANPGHNKPDTMARFENPAHWNVPLANHPQDVLDYHALGVWFASDLPVITPVSLSVNFGNVPENLTTFKPIQFEVRTCQPVHFRITGISPGTNFSVPAGMPSTSVDHDPALDPVKADVYVQFQALGLLSSPQAAIATVEAFIDDADGYFAASVGGEYILGTWTVNLAATPIPKPRSAVTLVLDRSGSMADSAGVAGSKYDLLKSSLSVLGDIMLANDGIGLVSFDDVYPPHTITTLAPVTGMGPVPATPGSGRQEVIDAIASPDLAPRGATAIGLGMIQGASVLNAERTSSGTPYQQFAMMVMTDGNENVTPYVTDPAVTSAISAFSDNVYAIGLGTAGNVSDATLGAIANYMLITGDVSAIERRFRLTKYFVQILAGITRMAIVVDPQGDLIPGAEHRIPFEVTEADISMDVIALCPLAPLLDFSLETPDGARIDSASLSPNVTYFENIPDAFYRVNFPALPASPGGSHAGKWIAILSLSERKLKDMLHKFDNLTDVLRQLRQTGTLPYSLVVQSYSNLMMEVDVQQASHQPGEVLKLHAALHEYQLPVSNRARVTVEISEPGGSITDLPLDEYSAGKFAGEYSTHLPGLYTCRFRASGYSLGGKAFQREETRSATVFKGIPPVSPDLGQLEEILERDRQRLCRLLKCLLIDTSAGELFERLGLKPEELVKCVTRYCWEDRPISRDVLRLAAIQARESEEDLDESEKNELRLELQRDLSRSLAVLIQDLGQLGLISAAKPEKLVPSPEMEPGDHEHMHHFSMFRLDEKGNVVEVNPDDIPRDTSGCEDEKPEDGHGHSHTHKDDQDDPQHHH